MCNDTETSFHFVPISRRRMAGVLALTLAELLLASCAPQSPPAPGSWAEEYYRRKAKYRRQGEGTSTK